MKQYFYIPLEHEGVLTLAVNDWISAPNYGWTIIIGVYESTLINRLDNSTVVNVLRKDREIINIPYTLPINHTTSTMQGLTAFCLEGDLDLYAPDFKAILLTLNGVQVFNTAEEYLNYINQ